MMFEFKEWQVLRVPCKTQATPAGIIAVSGTPVLNQLPTTFTPRRRFGLYVLIDKPSTGASVCWGSVENVQMGRHY
jgi:hypothetical protein